MPATKSSAVATAPIRTSLQAIRASGMTLKIAANSSAMTASDPAKLIASRIGAESPAGRNRPSWSPNAESTALTTSDTSRMNASPSTIPMPNTRLSQRCS